MFLVRDIMYCKPGQARPMVQKFLALAKLGPQMGLGPMRVMTDVSAERYWTVVSEMEVESLEKYHGAVTKVDGDEGISGSHEGLPRAHCRRPTRDLPDRNEVGMKPKNTICLWFDKGLLKHLQLVAVRQSGPFRR